MTKFTYIGGKIRSENEAEVGGVDAPDSTTLFDIKFILGVPTEVLRSNFVDQAKYEHALRKLRDHRFFKEYVEELAAQASEPEKTAEPVKRGPGRPPRVTVGLSEDGVG